MSSRRQDEVQFAVENLPLVKRQGMPRERTMETDCISKISVSMCEDICTASVRGAKKNQCLIEGAISSQQSVGQFAYSNIKILNL